MSLMLDHVGLQVRDLAVSKAFYTAVLAPLGSAPILDFGVAVGFGPELGSARFWLSEAPGELAGEQHIGFAAASRAEVEAFHRAALDTGAEELHPPGVRPEYHENYYGAFVRDPDGNNVEAVHHGAPE